MRADRWNYQLDKALEFMEANKGKYRTAKEMLDDMRAKGLIQNYRVNAAGFIALKFWDGWHGTMLRVQDFGYNSNYIQKPRTKPDRSGHY